MRGGRFAVVAVAISFAGQAEVSIDGITRGVVSLYNPTTITRTFEYTGLAAGPHVVQIRPSSGRATMDAFYRQRGHTVPAHGGLRRHTVDRHTSADCLVHHSISTH
jgi:hypothetical protein